MKALIKYVLHILRLRNKRFIFHKNSKKPYEYGLKPCAFGQAGQTPQMKALSKERKTSTICLITLRIMIYYICTNTRSGSNPGKIPRSLLLQSLQNSFDIFREYFRNIEKGTTDEMSYSSGVKTIDRIVYLVGKDRMGKYPQFNSITTGLAHLVFSSGFPFFLYMLSKQPQVSRISKIVRN